MLIARTFNLVDTMHSTPTDCGVYAVGQARIPFTEFTALRRQPPPLPARPGAALALRHADEHTLVALRAAQQAIKSAGWDVADLSEWGVVVSSRFPGRVGMGHLIHRFEKLGPLGAPPIAVPTLSLHSAAGTLSLVLGLGGPNIGVSGGAGHVAEGLLAGLALEQDRLAPGILVVLTGSDPELVPDALGKVGSTGTMHAVALALSHRVQAIPLLHLRMNPTAHGQQHEPMSLGEFASLLEGDAGQVPSFGNGVIEVVRRTRALPVAA